MDYIFKEWQKAIEKLHDSLEKDIEEVRRQKEEVQAMKTDIFNSISAGRYIRDESRIVISAPEIVIGNVDKSGDLWGNGSFSKIIIRGNDVNLEGVGRSGNEIGGSITSRASSIRNIAVDPGMDGCENVVRNNSEIVNQARSIVLEADNEEKIFSGVPASPGAGGVLIHADSGITVDASLENEGRSKRISSRKEDLKKEQTALKQATSNGKSAVTKIISDIQKTLDETEGKNEDMDKVSGNIGALQDIQTRYEHLVMSLYSAMTTYLHNLASLAEVNRSISALEATDKKLSGAKSGYKKTHTGASINMTSETINVSCVDGDGNIRETPSSGVYVRARNLNVSATDGKGALIKDGKVGVQAQTVSIATSDSKASGKNADFPATGTVSIVSKDISLSSVDYELKDKKITEKALAKGGCLSIRAEKVSVSATDTEGKATGSIDLNAKAIGIKSMDVDKESRAQKSLAAGSTMTLVSEKMYAGALEKDKDKSKSVQIASEQIGIIAKTTAELQQDKAVVQLTGGNVSAGGGKTEFYGDTTVNGKAEFKADVKAPKLTADNLEASKSFKSTNISDGIAVPGAPSSAKLSAKIAEEAAPKAEEGKK